MFTQQHYEQIAQIISCTSDGKGNISKRGLVKALIGYFVGDNDRFNADKFIEACYKDNPTENWGF